MEKESHDPKILKEAAEYAAIHVLPKAGTPEFDTYLEMAKKDIEDKKISKEAVDHLFWEISYQLWIR